MRNRPALLVADQQLCSTIEMGEADIRWKLHVFDKEPVEECDQGKVIQPNTSVQESSSWSGKAYSAWKITRSGAWEGDQRDMWSVQGRCIGYYSQLVLQQVWRGPYNMYLEASWLFWKMWKWNKAQHKQAALYSGCFS